MTNKLEEIFDNTIPHSAFLDKKSVINCMHQSYKLGKQESEQNYNILKSTFESLLEKCEPKIQMEKDWKKEGGLL